MNPTLLPKIISVGILCLLTSCAGMDPLYWVTGSTILIDSFTYQDESGRESLDYDLLILRPEFAGEKHPLLFSLHAIGGSASDISSYLEEQAKKNRFMVLAPFQDRKFSDRSFDLDMLFALVDDVIERYPVKRDEIHVLGISSGSFILRWMMMRRPDYFHKAVLISTETYDDWTEDVDFEDFPPMMFVHGKEDPVFDIDKIRLRVKEINEQGGTAELIETPEIGHAYNHEWTAEIFEWLTRE